MAGSTAVRATGWLALALCLWSEGAGAQPARLDLGPPTPAEIEARLEFLTERLEAKQLHGQVWYYGWLGVFTAGLALNAVEAATQDGDGRVAAIVNAGKSVIAITRTLMAPLPTRLGADPVLALPGGTPGADLARLRVAERLLEGGAERAEVKHTVWPHLSTVLLNLVGGGIILAFGDWQDAALSAGSGIAVGEARIWTAPDQPRADLAAYRALYGMAPARAEVGWSLEARPDGIALAYRF